MVAASQPTATVAGLRVLSRGGNAVDAALAAAATLCVTEPMSTGPGGDLFALVFTGAGVEGLDGAGPAPRGASPGQPPAQFGPTSVTVPGAVAGWAALAERYGRLGLEACLEDAVELARGGFAVGRRCAAMWAAAAHVPEQFRPAPRPGRRVALPDLARTLADIAHNGPAVFYQGRVGEAICSASWLQEADLAAYQPRWVTPLEACYEGHTVLEMPPPAQGIAALEGLALLDRTERTLVDRITCSRLALEDALREVRDGADVGHLLEPANLERRLANTPANFVEPGGGTVYLCAVDPDGMGVSLVQSLFEGFGSGVVAADTGIVLQNRGACFSVNGSVEPGRRPYHTIIPGMISKDGDLVGPFGVMGGFVQAQAHLQLVHGLLSDGLDPQTALDRPRFRVQGDKLLLERGLWEVAPTLSVTGLRRVLEHDRTHFGGGQAIMRTSSGTLIGGSDSRKDGCAAGW